MIRVQQNGDFKKITTYLEKIKHPINESLLNKYGREGVSALEASTPVDTGQTAKSWRYATSISQGKAVLSFHNTNIQNGVPIAIILQYGHATGNGGWVEGRDYINPALRPVFDRLAKEAWREVTKS